MPGSDFGGARVLVLLVMLMIVGGRRVRHLRTLRQDALITRMCGLKSLPTPKSAGRWLSGFAAEHLDAVGRLNERIAAGTIGQVRRSD